MPRFRAFVVVAVLTAVPAFARAESAAADAAAHLERGEQALTEGRLEDAVKELKRANKLQGGACGRCEFMLSVAYLRAGDENSALRNAEKAIQHSSEPQLAAQSQALRGEVLLAFAGSDGKRLREAEAGFRTALQLDPAKPRYRLKLGESLLRQSRDEEGIRELRAYLDAGATEAGVELATKWIAEPRRARETFAPEFEIETVAGETLTLGALAGRVVVLDFWATWCQPCVESLPELRALTKRYPNEKLVLVSISVDDDEKAWSEFLLRRGMDWPQYRDADRRMSELFQVRSFPTYVLIDGEGIIRQRISGMDRTRSVAVRLREHLEGLRLRQ